MYPQVSPGNLILTLCPFLDSWVRKTKPRNKFPKSYQKLLHIDVTFQLTYLYQDVVLHFTDMDLADSISAHAVLAELFSAL